MINWLEFITFILFCLYVLKNAISYGIFECKNKNKFGGITVIIFSLFSVILSIIALYLA